MLLNGQSVLCIESVVVQCHPQQRRPSMNIRLSWWSFTLARLRALSLVSVLLRGIEHGLNVGAGFGEYARHEAGGLEFSYFKRVLEAQPGDETYGLCHVLLRPHCDTLSHRPCRRRAELPSIHREADGLQATWLTIAALGAWAQQHVGPRGPTIVTMLYHWELPARTPQHYHCQCTAIGSPNVLASVGAEGQLRIWDARGQPTFQWGSPGRGPITCLAPVGEDGLLVAGQGLNPSLLSLNYSKALDRLPEAFARMSLARRRPSESLEGAGPGRHTDLRRRQPRASRQPSVEVGEFRESRGAFDRCRKPKAVPLGSSGSTHRSLLCGLRR
ncbi:ansA [Symbiodinium sp. CCMP2592]|nr:ansA [Symbiodinium sp. CCMP2592]